MLIKTSKKGNTRGGTHRLGRVRSEVETNLRQEWGSSSWTDEQIDKARYIEKKYGITEGWVDTGIVDKVK